MTSPWSINELETIGAAAELSVAPRPAADSHLR
jgi:hypothetical protein